MAAPIKKRDFIRGIASACCCSCFNQSAAAQTFTHFPNRVHDKQIVCGNDPASPNASFRIDKRLTMTRCGREIDWYIDGEIQALNSYFQTSSAPPTFFFYHDAKLPIGAKAVRTDEDQTIILLGTALIDEEVSRSVLWGNSIVGTLAHEWAHHLQYEASLADRTFQLETHADFMSGWYMGVKKRFGVDINISVFSSSLYLKGVARQATIFNPNQYGSPPQRVNAMLRGFVYGFHQAGLSNGPEVSRAATDGYRIVSELAR